MKYNGIKVIWRLILLETVLLIVSGVASLLLEKYIGVYPAMAVSQIHLLIPIFIGTAYLSKKRYHMGISNMLGVRGFDYGIVFFVLILPMASQNFSGLLTTPFIEELTEMFGEQVDFDEIKSVSEFIWLFISLCIVAPFLEEILFRGVFMKILEPYGAAASIFISAFGFALVHFSVPAFIVIFFVGIVMGFIRLYSGSIFPGILFHSLFNLQSLMLIVIEKDMDSILLPIGIINIVSALLFPVLMFAFYRMYGRNKWYKGIIKNLRGGTVSLIITLIIYACMAAVSYAALNMNIEFFGG